MFPQASTRHTSGVSVRLPETSGEQRPRRCRGPADPPSTRPVRKSNVRETSINGGKERREHVSGQVVVRSLLWLDVEGEDAKLARRARGKMGRAGVGWAFAAVRHHMLTGSIPSIVRVRPIGHKSFPFSPHGPPSLPAPVSRNPRSKQWHSVVLYITDVAGLPDNGTRGVTRQSAHQMSSSHRNVLARATPAP